MLQNINGVLEYSDWIYKTLLRKIGFYREIFFSSQHEQNEM